MNIYICVYLQIFSLPPFFLSTPALPSPSHCRQWAVKDSNTHTHKNTHAFSLSFFLSFSHTFTHSHTPQVMGHKNIESGKMHIRTNTHTHTHTHTHIHTQTHTCSSSLSLVPFFLLFSPSFVFSLSLTPQAMRHKEFG